MCEDEYVSKVSLIKTMEETPFVMSMCLNIDECNGMNRARKIFTEIFKDLPAADVTPVVHGEWVDGPHGETMCNACGYECETGLLKEIATAFETFPKCCPNCGAKMDKT